MLRSREEYRADMLAYEMLEAARFRFVSRMITASLWVDSKGRAAMVSMGADGMPLIIRLDERAR